MTSRVLRKVTAGRKTAGTAFLTVTCMWYPVANEHALLYGSIIALAEVLL